MVCVSWQVTDIAIKPLSKICVTTLYNWVGSSSQKPLGRVGSRVKNPDPVPSLTSASVYTTAETLLFLAQCIFIHKCINLIKNLKNLCRLPKSRPSPRMTDWIPLCGKSSSLRSAKLEWPTLSAMKSSESRPPNISLAAVISAGS